MPEYPFKLWRFRYQWTLWKDGMICGILYAWCLFTVKRYLRENMLDKATGELYDSRHRAMVQHTVFPTV